MVGQDGVFLLISFFAGRAAQAETVIAAAMDQGVRRIVWNATGPILPFDTGNPSIDMRRGILAALEASGISFVALQPTVYMENFLIPAIAQEVATADVGVVVAAGRALPVPEERRKEDQKLLPLLVPDPLRSPGEDDVVLEAGHDGQPAHRAPVHEVRRLPV